jgi:hypothetical protein
LGTSFGQPKPSKVQPCKRSIRTKPSNSPRWDFLSNLPARAITTTCQSVLTI